MCFSGIKFPGILPEKFKFVLLFFVRCGIIIAKSDSLKVLQPGRVNFATLFSEMRDDYLRKLTSMIVVATLLLACLIPVSAAGVEFKDVSGHWAEEYILQAGERSLVQGYNGAYRPDDSMTRAELVTILWRAMGEPQPKGEASFTDLTQDWYKQAVAWAEENAVVNGVAPGKFNPNGNVTREQVAAILFRLAGSTSGMELMFTSIYDDYYKDEQTISSYAKSAVYWCIYNYIYCGEASVAEGDTLAPKADATRGQIAVMMVRYLDRNN